MYLNNILFKTYICIDYIGQLAVIPVCFSVSFQ